MYNPILFRKLDKAVKAEQNQSCDFLHHPHFTATVLFKVTDEETEIDWALLFNTTEMFEMKA
ncbi:hypothetical protein [Pedobacter gandavensis]|uniref:hypothetical protein n=1 Tax=Pedobacter gandavensis TaxID=2679963 RepID=UPI00292D8594|nr:hypothetical protein [Pedobacter gandavensis]